ncbi:AsnC family transcriptional regulator [Gluconobacter thailandicus NBRC 3257]|uniref:AsnC family transcriptional regulator n=2 Tax=Gluconobacter thailandicus TaxID=257438 RepID=A0ABQ0IYE5_GLUTH|nr:AsnC family transcriptional regulator [Gluconobacter thailandicus NBRC 3255]GAD27239.1 AsnC family transcriptional regulator [Gluconobacter thailandicus NBRC 3257]
MSFALLIEGSNATKTHLMNKKAPAPSRLLDLFDRAILRIVQKDNKMPQRQIAEKVNLSAAAVQRRIAAMEKSGVIIRNSAMVDARSLQMGITSIVEVMLTDERLQTVDNAKALFRAAPEVQQCYYVTGGVSFMLVIVSQDITTYEETTRRLFAQNEAVASYRSLIALDRVKVGSDILIP